MTLLPSVLRNLARESHHFSKYALPIRHLSAIAPESEKSFDVVASERFLSDFDDVSVRAELSKLRQAETELMGQVESSAVTIDWDHWKKAIRYPGLVDEVKQIFDEIKTPDLEQEKKEAEAHIESVFNPIIEHYDQLVTEAEEETQKLEKDLGEAEFIRDNIQDLSSEEFLKRNPSLKKSIEDDVANNKWFVE